MSGGERYYFNYYFLVPAIVQQAENQTVKEGSNVVVYCNVTAGIPDPTVLWRNVTSGEPIKENPLNITSISRDQAGEYKCTANNTCGKESTVAYIDVQCKHVTDTLYKLLYSRNRMTLVLLKNCRKCATSIKPHSYKSLLAKLLAFTCAYLTFDL